MARRGASPSPTSASLAMFGLQGNRTGAEIVTPGASTGPLPRRARAMCVAP